MMVRSLFTTPVPEGVGYSPATVAATLAESLESLGHEVTFYGPEGTNLKVSHIETCGIQPEIKAQQDFDEYLGNTDLFHQYLLAANDNVMVKDMLERADKGEFDCVVFHHFESAMTIAGMYPNVPVVYILHDAIDAQRKTLIDKNKTPNQHFISISENQRNDAPDINYLATVFNGIDTEEFEFNSEPGEYLFFSGRITPYKGVREAIQVAVATKRQLLIAGPLAKADYAYFDEHVKPYLDDKILYLGMLDKGQLIKYYRRAYALLVPIQWQEPFGLTMIEANACGTPVIAFRKGAAPEIIQDSKNGFLVDNTAEMILAVSQIPTISRKNCRDHVVKHFTQEIMTKSYEKTFETVSQKSKTRSKSARK